MARIIRRPEREIQHYLVVVFDWPGRVWVTSSAGNLDEQLILWRIASQAQERGPIYPDSEAFRCDT